MLNNSIWTPEKLATRSLEDVEQIRVNALRADRNDIVVLCDFEIARRTKASRTERRPLRGIHLICEGASGVVHEPDGTFRTGSWAIAKKHAEQGKTAGIYVALHERHSELSYLQGIIKDWRLTPRESLRPGEQIKIDEGVEFLLDPLPEPFPWRGNGIVERSYWYGDHAEVCGLFA
ncbi:hypothetical protein [Bradyrhizobium sp. SRS-191]|uniref:hypothetical protein n=1 Tax=Bradyrhizobium sp. SRS-191 TaxID=2962606 RepID=UPI00211E9496|nr:hypothetical protein [Bradyrhizobium sp. SRS-191]